MKIVNAIIVTALTISSMSAEITIPEVEVVTDLESSGIPVEFQELPKGVELLGQSAWLDMLDFYTIDSLYRAPNGLGGESVLEKVTSDYLKAKITPISILEMKLLPTSKSNLLLSITTVGDSIKAHDSRMTIYDSENRELQLEKYINLPVLSDFLTCTDKSTIASLESLVPFETIEYKLGSESLDLTATLTVDRFMNREDYARLKEYLKPELVYKWDGKRYKLVK